MRMRLSDRDSVDDIVQETFLGFLRSLPHFDSSRDLESYLFTIASHKIRDHLRRNGRHPLNLLGDISSESHPREPSARIRGPSSLLASRERVEGEEAHLVHILGAMLNEWREKGEFRRIKCMELVFVSGWSNLEISKYLGLTERQVANYRVPARRTAHQTRQRNSLCLEPFLELPRMCQNEGLLFMKNPSSPNLPQSALSPLPCSRPHVERS